MIVYFDTSALVAMYIVDRCSPWALRARRNAEHITTSHLAYAEALAAFGTATRVRALAQKERERIEARFVVDWAEFHRIQLDARILPDVRRILRHHPLKAADAVHLASALLVARRCAVANVAYQFACDDRALTTAAIAEGLSTAW